MNQASSQIISSNEVMPRVYLIWLESPQIVSIVQPGQFVMVRCGENNLLRRPFSIHQVNDDKTSLALLFSVVGRGTDWLSKQQAGGKIDLLGPLGNGFSIYPTSRNLLLVGGGIGIAPLRFLADEVIKQGRNITLALGHTHGVSLNLLVQQIKEVKAEAVRIVPVSEDGTLGIKGLVTKTIKKLCPEADQVFACGPSPMYRTMAKTPELKDKSVQISLEVRMGCGLGVCYGCTVNTKQGLKQVCKDGPIFELNDILWDEFVDI